MDMTAMPVILPQGPASRPGLEFTQLASARLIALRQFMKYEHTRADADAALKVGRWRLGVLSARAAVGFAVDVILAMQGRAVRDEIHRRLMVDLIFDDDSSGSAEEFLKLLTHRVERESANQFVRECWTFIDDALQLDRLDIPPYYLGDPREHKEERLEWLKLAKQIGARPIYSPQEVDQLTKYQSK
jgi:hypothetical protein